MKVNWKQFSQSPGYRSLKAAYIRDVQNAAKRKCPMRDKQEFFNHFNWVIGRALHYAHVLGTTPDIVLNAWEMRRSYWWLNFYQENEFPKLGTGKPRNVKRMKADTQILQHISLKTVNRFYKLEAFLHLQHCRTRNAQYKRKASGKKPRWDNERKRHQARYRAK